MKKKSEYELDHTWPVQRSRNIEAMWKRVRDGDDAYALALAIGWLTTRSDQEYQSGDVNHSLLIAVVRTKLDNMRVRISTRAKRKKKPKA